MRWPRHLPEVNESQQEAVWSAGTRRREVSEVRVVPPWPPAGCGSTVCMGESRVRAVRGSPCRSSSRM